MPDSEAAKRKSAPESGAENDSKKARSDENSNVETDSESFAYEIKCGAFGNKGLKQHLEDTWTTIHSLRPFGSPSLSSVRSAFFALFDGHAGKTAAEYCAEKLHVNIASRIDTPTDNEIVRKAIIDGFKETDTGFLSLATSKNYKDGCTAVTATLIRDILFVAWVGDSKAVLARREAEDAQSRVKALNITKDHSCIQAKERERIVKAGGFIENNRVNGIMEVSRSIGDQFLKKSGVICTPEIQRITLCPRDEFLLLACDGLWRVYDAKDVCDFVIKGLREGLDEETVCQNLVREAIRVRQAHDNVSALLITFRQRS